MRRLLTVAVLALGAVALVACGSSGGGGEVPSSNWNELVWSEGSWSK